MASDLLSTIRDEIDARLRELQPLLAEYERLLVAAQALDHGTGTGLPTAADGALSDAGRAARRGRKPAARKASLTPRRGRTGRAAPSRRSATEETILAVLEHGSHTVGELVVVTAMSATKINGGLRRLASQGAVAKTEREGKIAWALSGSETG